MDQDTLAPTQVVEAPSGRVDVDLPLLEVLPAERLVKGELLGLGGMGEVYLCYDTRLGRELALKLMTHEHGSAPSRFVREARIQGQLEHPGIVPIHELGLDPDGQPFFTMKRVRGRTLADVLAALAAKDAETEGRFPRRRLLTAFQQVCQAMDFAHARGVVHRDLKPANIMLGDYGEAYVLDWGLAKMVDEPTAEPPLQASDSAPGHTAVGTVLGTPGYMAPEQAKGEPVTPKADVWSLGAVLFEVLTLRPLVTARQPAAAIVETVNGVELDFRQRAPDVEVPPELERDCQRALSASPDARPTARELHQAIEEVLAGELDAQLRTRVAQRHASAAEKHAAVLLAKTGDDLAERRAALREVGRALALDPDNAVAADTFVRLVAKPPSVTPPEVSAALERLRDARSRQGVSIALWGFGGMALLSPVVGWMGVHSWPLFGLLGAMWLLFMGYLLRLRRGRAPSRRVLQVGLVLSFAVTSANTIFGGPFLLVPALAATNTMGAMLWVERGDRLQVLALAVAAVLVPVLAGLLGWGPWPYVFDAEGMRIVPQGVSFPPTPSLWFFSLSALATVATAALASWKARDGLDEAQAAIALYQWNLERLRGQDSDPRRGEAV